ncbi:hypothetical protein V866_001843 [Kwoniella sp. B9012]
MIYGISTYREVDLLSANRVRYFRYEDPRLSHRWGDLCLIDYKIVQKVVGQESFPSSCQSCRHLQDFRKSSCSSWQRSNRTGTDDHPTARGFNPFDLTRSSDSQDMQIIRRSTNPTSGSNSRDQSTNLALVRRRRNPPAEHDGTYTNTSGSLIGSSTTDGTRDRHRQGRRRRRRQNAERTIGSDYGPPHAITEEYRRPSRRARSPFEARNIPFPNGPGRMPNNRPIEGFPPGFFDDPRDRFDGLYQDLSTHDPTSEDDYYYDSGDGWESYREDYLVPVRVPTVRSSFSIISGRCCAGPCPRCGRFH